MERARMNVREIELATPRITLAARAWGDPDAPRVLALHGWLDNAASFDALAPLLRDVQLVALDLPGHGRSAHRAPGAWYHYIDYLGDVLAAADTLGWDRFTLLGHSLGGAIASVLAGAVPERIERLWLIEALGPISTAPDKGPELLRKAMHERVAIAEKSLRVFPTLDDAVTARRSGQASTLSERAARTIVERGTRAVDGGYVWSSDPRLTLTSAMRLTEEQVVAYVGAIECPTLLVFADPPLPWVTGEAIRRRIAAVRDIEVRTLAGTHHLHLEDPQPVADAIEAFRARRG
jgi:pimeloyl-ACP methyl ester carboxylesterase